MIEVAKSIGEKHPKFGEIVNLVVAHENAIADEPGNGSIKHCLELAGVTSGRGNLRFTLLRCAKTLTEVQAESDPLEAEKNFRAIAGLCKTKREKTALADDITAHIMPNIASVRLLTVGDRALMDNVLAKYGRP